LPIVHSIDTPEYDLVKTADCGISVPAANAHAIAIAVAQIASMPKEARRLIGQRGQAYVRANHTYPVLADQFIESVTSI
jgi:glycosyltransferase involved in cell wall biosynthesis